MKRATCQSMVHLNSESEFEDGHLAPATGPARRILMIAAAFPPIGGPGVQRSAKFAKYLPESGWHPIVWAVDDIQGLPHDPSLLDELGAIEIHRRRVNPGAARRAAFPDELAPWVDASFGSLLTLIESHDVSAIYSTFSPAANHLLGLRLKQATGLPWIADFRDLWTDDYRYATRGWMRRRAERRLENAILRTADRVIGVNLSQTAILTDHVPDRACKFHTITNGFDPCDLPECPAATADRASFELAYVGRLDTHRASDALVEGLGRFVKRLGLDSHQFVFRITGHASAATLDRLRTAGVAVQFEPYVSHREALARMSIADALLIAIPDLPRADNTLPAKVFECLAVRRPILHVGPRDGECARLLRDLRAGIAVPFSAESVAAALARIRVAIRHDATAMTCHPMQIHRFTRRALTVELAQVLDAITATADTAKRTNVRHTLVGAAR